MSSDPSGSRPKRDAEREFFLARAGPHEQQVGYVGARNQQEKSYGSQQQPKCSAYFFADDVFIQAHKIEADILIVLGILLGYVGADVIQIRLRLREVQARLEPADHLKDLRTPLAQITAF